jgi:hypothetical protein
MKLKRTLSVVLFFILFTAACSRKTGPFAVQPVTGLPASTDGLPWWNDTLFCEIFVRSFYDPQLQKK